MSLVFFTNPMSRGRIIRWALEETLPGSYEAVLVEWGAMPEALLQANPIGKVPVIIHETASGRHVVSETPAICAYLADLHPETSLAPQDEERAAYYRWVFFAAGPVEQAFLFSALKLPVSDDAQAQGVLGFGNFARTNDMLEAHFSTNAYACGDRFTMADLYLSSQLGWGMQFGALEKRPVFESYVERCFARPAHIRASAMDDALLPAD